MKKFWIIFLATSAVVLLASGCFSPGRLLNLVGTWNVTLHSSGHTKYGTFVIDQHNYYNFTGEFCENSSCKDLYGMVSKDRVVNINSWTGESGIDFNGVATEDTMSGTFTIFSPLTEGTWQADKLAPKQ